MANSGLSRAEIRVIWKAWECQPSKMDYVKFPGENGKVWSLLVADRTVPAWNIFAAIMADHEYYFREAAGGTYNCNAARKASGSIHMNGLAIDLNPSENPFHTTTTDMPPAFVEDVEAVQCNNGIDVFRWGMLFQDPMHWEINCRPSDLATGINGGIMSWKSKDGYTYETDGWAPHEKGIQWIINAGLMVGARDVKTMTGDFMPDRPVNRDEFATIALRLATDADIKDEIDD
jgi:D-alanyl-D-alanine carboxypeptidase